MTPQNTPHNTRRRRLVPVAVGGVVGARNDARSPVGVAGGLSIRPIEYRFPQQVGFRCQMSTASREKRYYPCMNLPPTNKGRRLPAEPLTRSEVRDLIGAASNRSTSGIRMRAMIAVMVGAGLRLAECLALEPRDIDTGKGTIRVRNGKGSKSATVGIDPWAAGHLDRWMDRRSQVGLNGRHPTFATYEAGKVGQPLDPRYVRQSLARLGKRAGIDKRVHPHGLRHSLAFDLAQQGVPMHAIQAQLRHASLAHTDRYVRHLMPAEVIDLMRQRTWEDDT